MSKRHKYRQMAGQEASRTKRGTVLMLVMIFGLILLGAAGGMVALSSHQTHDRGRYETYKDEFAAAEVALNKAFSHTQFMVTYGTPDLLTEIANMTPPTVEDMNFTNFAVTESFNGFETVNTGQWAGLNLYRVRYQIDVTAQKTNNVADRFNNPGATLRQTMELTYIPLYLYAIFYDPVMEIAPGPYMQVNGLVHANGDSYIQSGGGLDFLKAVSSAGDIFHGRHPESGQGTSYSSVKFTNGSTLQEMNQSGSWLDSRITSWLSDSTSRWNNKVRDEAHGVTPLGLPIPPVADPHSIIERSSPSDPYSLQKEKFENKSTLKIIRQPNGSITGEDADGNPVDLSYEVTSGGVTQTKYIYSQKTFYDSREKTYVNSIDLDLSRMIEGNIIPPNGLVYVSNEDNASGPGVVRLVNGQELPQSPIVEGFSVATDDPIYIKGDFNTVNQTLSMVAGDALYLLSNSWNDTNSVDSKFSSRVASNTTVNTVALHGIVPTDNNNYSGGVENNFRFLEKWGGKDLKFNGSIVILWESQKAIGKWKYGSPVYEAPTRKWAWDTALGGVNGPPGAPRVIEIMKQNWELPVVATP